MTFIHPALLAGLALVALPVLLHLIMRQQPKHVLFPAFRFLQQRARTNQRKIRLRHLLLLLLRMLLIAAICLALSRPRFFSEGLHIGGDQPVAAVLVIDTSPSMEYAAGGQTRLDAVKQRALEFIDDLPPDGSKVAVIDTADPFGEWLPSLPAARERVKALTVRAANAPATDAVGAAYRLLQGLESESGPDVESLPRVVVVFSDRTANAWDPSRAADLAAQRDRMAPSPKGLFIDVGAESPVNLAITGVEMASQVVPADQPAVARVAVQATGQDFRNVLQARFDDEPIERREVSVRAGQTQVVEFRRKDLKPGLHHAEFSLATADSLPGDNQRFVTFRVREPRLVLTIADDADAARAWQLVLTARKLFTCEVKTPAQVREWTPDQFSKYEAVCLLSVAAPASPPTDSLWERLDRYVASGGHLAILPGGDELQRADYNEAKGKDTAALRLMPGQLVKLVEADARPGVTWDWKNLNYQHLLLAKFRDWEQLGNVDFVQNRPTARKYWEVKPVNEKDGVIVRYDDESKRPAMLERLPEGGRGRVLLFTTPFDGRKDSNDRFWNDYLQSSFFLVWANETMTYLVGSSAEQNFNYQTGQVVPVPLPPAPRFPTYTLAGPGVAGNDALLSRPEGQNELRIRATGTPGNFVVTGGQNEWSAGYSLNPSAAESMLDRVPAESIEGLFGPNSLIPVGREVRLRDELTSRFTQPVELFPALMLFLLFALAVENLLANRFYRNERAKSEPSPSGPG